MYMAASAPWSTSWVAGSTMPCPPHTEAVTVYSARTSKPAAFESVPLTFTTTCTCPESPAGTSHLICVPSLFQ